MNSIVEHVWLLCFVQKNVKWCVLITWFHDVIYDVYDIYDVYVIYDVLYTPNQSTFTITHLYSYFSTVSLSCWYVTTFSSTSRFGFDIWKTQTVNKTLYISMRFSGIIKRTNFCVRICTFNHQTHEIYIWHSHPIFCLLHSHRCIRMSFSRLFLLLPCFNVNA
jgi:hypothetical protein